MIIAPIKNSTFSIEFKIPVLFLYTLKNFSFSNPEVILYLFDKKSNKLKKYNQIFDYEYIELGNVVYFSARAFLQNQNNNIRSLFNFSDIYHPPVLYSIFLNSVLVMFGEIYVDKVIK